jgi:hypothetical protein
MRTQINKAVNTILWKNPPASSSVSIEILTSFWCSSHNSSFFCNKYIFIYNVLTSLLVNINYIHLANYIHYHYEFMELNIIVIH